MMPPLRRASFHLQTFRNFSLLDALPGRLYEPLVMSYIIE
jgi:hypothetical protein